MTIADVGMLFQFIGGLGMFLYGMNAMADGLQKSAGSRMKQFLAVLTNNRLIGVLMGAAITAIIQSSSATTVMVVGFVNAGMLNLGQAVGIIMGANIGTTVTSWLVSMSEWGAMMKPEFFAPLLIGIGAFLALFCKSHKKNQVGEILIGFGVLFIGLSFMSSSIEPYREAEVFSKAFQVLGGNPILGILAGAAVTGIIQSSSASVGILQTLAMNGMVGWNSAVFITLGQNIGTCVTALISSAGAHKTAKRAAVIHLLFNVVGAAIFGVLMWVMFRFEPNWAAAPINSVEISIFHTIFNVTNTILLFPFANLLVKASMKIIKEDPSEEAKENAEESILRHLDDRILGNAAFAIETITNEVVNMGKLAYESLNLAEKALTTEDVKSMNKVFANEKVMDRLDTQLTEYLVKINGLSLNDDQNLAVKNLFYTINDMERVGDHCENLAELAQQRINEKIVFSAEAAEDLKQIFDVVKGAFKSSIDARAGMDMKSVRLVVKGEEEVDNLEEELREKHIKRLSENLCEASRGVIFLDVVSNLERISDHALNIAGYVRDEL